MVAQPFAPGTAFANLSSDVAIQLILADIPIFSVGMVAFGVLTFFFLMKRVDKWVFCLHVSVLLAFLAALFDLSQILIRGRRETDRGVDNAGVSGLITAREVFYAFANGLRFLFYWGFVSTIPLGETMPEGTVMHSGSWQRWGLSGTIVQWATLLLIALSTILQLVFRNVQAFEKIGPVYEAEGALEIIMSAVFMIKLFLNSWTRFSVGSTTPPSSKMLMQYAPVVVALLLSFWIAVGNVVLFEFTETVLGRLLRAIELYILIVYMLTISFHHLRHLSFFPVYRPATRGPSGAATLRRDSIAKVNDNFDAVPPAIPKDVARVDLLQVLEGQFRKQEMPPTITRDTSRAPTVHSVTQHQSMAARLSTWLGVARPLPRPPQQSSDVQSWDVDTERGPSPTVQVAPFQAWNVPNSLRAESPPLPPPPSIDEDEQRGASPIPEHVPKPKTNESDGASPVSSTAPEYQPAPGIVEPEEERTPLPDRDWRDIEYSNASNSARSSDISILRRRQTELDESIAALRLFSPSKLGFEANEMPVPPTMFYTQLAQPVAQGKERTSITRSIESPELPAPSPDLTLATPRAVPQSSVRSEFSFGHFDHQPPLNRSSMDSGVIPRRSVMSVGVDGQGKNKDNSNEGSPRDVLQPLPTPAATVSRFSDSSSVARKNKAGSVGTQYEITSFIGNLTVPQSQKDSTTSEPSAVSSEDDSADVAVATKADLGSAQYARPTLVIQPLGREVPAPEGLHAPSQSSPMSSPLRTPGGRRALPPIPQPSPQSQIQQPVPQPSQPFQLSPPAAQQLLQPAPTPQPVTQNPVPRFRRAVGLPPRPRLSLANVGLTPVEEKATPSETSSALESSSQNGTRNPASSDQR
ncbi:hypothetical protein BD414DRAFT_534664 [Trametes punicea]|nr:hypothetical protein BD414DRAFT_534664 [Trametes punicea]